jgi:hypothetical protein
VEMQKLLADAGWFALPQGGRLLRVEAGPGLNGPGAHY